MFEFDDKLDEHIPVRSVFEKMMFKSVSTSNLANLMKDLLGSKFDVGSFEAKNSKSGLNQPPNPWSNIDFFPGPLLEVLAPETTL